MVDKTLLAEQMEETRLIIKDLLEDGSDPEASYTIEHHFASETFENLENAAVEAFKLGYEVTEAEEFETDDGMILFCCDVISEMPLQEALIDKQVEQLFAVADRHHIYYDGWGTYFEDPEGDDWPDDDESDEDEPIA